MLDKETSKIMSQEQKYFGISNGLKQFSPFPFGGMDQTSSSRQGMQDQHFWFLENFLKTGDGCLRTLWDEGTAIYTSPIGITIIYFFFFNIGSTNYVAIFLSDGTAVQVNTGTLVTSQISSTQTLFYSGSQLPVGGQWGSQYLLIANNITQNSYWIWDGMVLYQAGSLAPTVTITNSGSGYSSSPTVIAFGGQGSGATFTATVTAGSITQVQVTNPGSGYKPGDVVQLQFSGGGSDTSAILTASLTATTIGHITLLSGGRNYSSAVTVAISGGGGTGATATATQVNGVINSITLTNVGSGFTSTPTVTFNDSSGSGALASVILTPTTVASIAVTNGGTSYNSIPTLSFSGGGGTGATATATLTAKVITSVSVGAAGSGYTSVPAVIVQSGINNAASATVNLMPFGVSGSSIETFQSRVWLPYPNQTGNQINGGIFLVSSPGSLTDFSTTNGGLQFTSTDSFLRSQYVNIKQSNGYLYPIGDSSVSVISNVQTGGSPTVTTFNYQNTDPQTGTSWRDSLQAYSRTILFANVFGVFGLYGGAVSKISQKMDNLFINMVSTSSGGVTPTSAVANIFNSKVYLLNFTFLDPTIESNRTIMIGWDEKEWYVFSQSSLLTFIGTQEINSNMTAWGTDGNSLYPLFNRASNLPKKISTKFYGENNFLIQKEAIGIYIQTQDLSFGSSGISFSSINVDAEHGSYSVPSIPAFPSTPPPYYAILAIGSGDVTACNLGLTLTTTSKDFTINMLNMSYIEVGSIAMASSSIDGQIDTL